MKLTQQSPPRLSSFLGRSAERVVRRLMSVVWRLSSLAGFCILLNASAAEPEGTVWSKYNNVIPTPTNTVSTDGRIPLGASGKGDQTHARGPAVILDGDTYKMWYSGYSGAYRIYYATSPDGLTWTKYDNNIPVDSDGSSTNGKIPLGTSGKGDVARAYSSAVIKDETTYKMWYSGYASAKFCIYYATSSNGLDWTKYDNTTSAPSDTISTNGRIPVGTTGKGDADRVYAAAVIKDGSTFKMWYTGYDGAAHRIYYATSSNGLDWTKYDNTIPANSDGSSTNGKIPLGTAGKGDDYYTGWPFVIKEGNTYKMWYGGHDGFTQRIYYATSSNGLEWTKYNNTIPSDSDTNSTAGRIPAGAAGKGDVGHAAALAVIKVGYTYYAWYDGYSTSYRIYHARILPPAGTILIFH
ncbi:MAG: hypothetical protein HYV36_01465 [Lentisphaerae bacterium]|nr:hypothetical protein [Lentisphaerota bacterium]